LLERAVQRPFFHAQLLAREHSDALRERVAVHRLAGEHAQDQENQRAGRQTVVSRHSLTMPRLVPAVNRGTTPAVWVNDPGAIAPATGIAEGLGDVIVIEMSSRQALASTSSG